LNIKKSLLKLIKLKFVRFLLAGSLGVIVYYVFLYGLTEFFLVPYLISSVIGSILNNVVNFITQKFWTFEDKDIRKTPQQAVWYSCKVIIILAINSALLWLLVEKLGFYYLIAQTLIIPLITILSFIISKLIFKNNKPKLVKSTVFGHYS
jgi:putative flippase GtrA